MSTRFLIRFLPCLFSLTFLSAYADNADFRVTYINNSDRVVTLLLGAQECMYPEDLEHPVVIEPHTSKEVYSVTKNSGGCNDFIHGSSFLEVYAYYQDDGSSAGRIYYDHFYSSWLGHKNSRHQILINSPAFAVGRMAVQFN